MGTFSDWKQLQAKGGRTKYMYASLKALSMDFYFLASLTIHARCAEVCGHGRGKRHLYPRSNGNHFVAPAFGLFSV